MEELKWTTLALSITMFVVMAYLFVDRFKKTSVYTFPRVLVLLVLLDSAAFVFCTIFLIPTNHDNHHSCSASIMVCDLLYFGAKLFLYLFFIEKVHAVRDGTLPKLKSKLFIINMVLLLPFVGILALLILFKTSLIDETGICWIGVHSNAIVPLISYDAFFNTYLTLLFIHPLVFNRKELETNPKIKRIVIKTLIGSVICLVSTVGNLGVLVAMGGIQLGYVCLACCSGDIFINALATYFCTKSDKGESTAGSAKRHISNLGSMKHQSVLNPFARKEEYQTVDSRKSKHSPSNSESGLANL